VITLTYTFIPHIPCATYLPPASLSPVLMVPSLRDALPIWGQHQVGNDRNNRQHHTAPPMITQSMTTSTPVATMTDGRISRRMPRSEEHTSELQSRFDIVCRLLLEKKNITTILS